MLVRDYTKQDRAALKQEKDRSYLLKERVSPTVVNCAVVSLLTPSILSRGVARLFVFTYCKKGTSLFSHSGSNGVCVCGIRIMFVCLASEDMIVPE